MIKYNLICDNKHEFESWFSDSQEFEKLKKKQLLECIKCNSKNISKSIMSPQIFSVKEEEYKIYNQKDEISLKLKRDLLKLRDFVEKNFEFVGNDFSTQVRDIYYNKKKVKKNIYGTANKDEKEELKNEGFDLISIPWIEKDN